ncbi:MAG: 50S ribosomal protein L30e [Candidatus Aenigmatarchaeota archaeon]|nr:MAG: 50S ribosomal protein L30e [Candidatus Aenigmarchaeota archaeon]
MDRAALVAHKGSVVLGFRAAKRAVAAGARTVVTAQNCPAAYVAELQKAGANVESFEGDSRELGVIYGKPFNVAVVALSGSAESKPKRKAK